MPIVPSPPAPAMRDLPARPRYPLSVRMDAVRMVSDLRGSCVSRREAITMVVGRIGCSRQTLINWVRAAERRQGPASGAPLPGGQRQRLQVLEREVRELRRANAALRRIVEAAGVQPPRHAG